MAGTTNSQALPYDHLTDTVATATKTGLQLLAEAVAPKLDAKDVQRVDALKRPAAAAEHASTLSIPNNTITTLHYTVEIYDTHGMVNLGANSDRITISASAGDGLYAFTCGTALPATGSTRLEMYLLRSGTVWAKQSFFGGIQKDMLLSGKVPLTSTQFLTVQVFQNSGGAINASFSLLQCWKVSQ